MKKFIYGLGAFILGSIAFIACDDEEFGALQSVPPSASAVNPGGIKLGSEAELQAAGADGVISPLSQGTLTLLDREFNVLATISDVMEGQADTISMDATTSGIAALDTGTYNLIAVTVDSEGNTSSPDTTSFEVFDLPFDANYPTMYMLGEFTDGWGGPPEERSKWEFKLIAANTWQLDSTEIDGQWKISVNSDFGDTDPNNEDWGDPDCTGSMISNLDPDRPDNTNTPADCVSPAVYNITFNDETFNYVLEEVILLESNLDDLFLLGSFNNFEGDEATFTLVDDHTWRLEGLNLSAGDEVKFSDKDNFSGNSYGDNEPDGVADLFGSNIMISATGVYTIVFNDQTLDYSFVVDCTPFQQAGMWVLGSMNGFGDNNPDQEMMMVDADNWTISGVAATNGDSFKFANTPNFTGVDWGDTNCDGIAEPGNFDNNIACITEDGSYTMTFNTCTLAYTITKE